MGAGFTPAAGSRFYLGNNLGGASAQVMGGVAGAAYITSAITPQQVSAHWNACRNAGFRMVQGAVAWEHRYDVRAPGGTFPAQIDDLEGTAHLSRVGVALVATTEQAF